MGMEQQTPIKKLVLVIEDDGILRTTLVDRLKGRFNVIEAGSGENGLKQIFEYKPDVVLLDLLLPGLNGFEVLEQVRSHPDPEVAKTKVIILSNLAPSADIVKAKQLSVSNYLTKSNISLDDIAAKINEALKGSTL